MANMKKCDICGAIYKPLSENEILNIEMLECKKIGSCAGICKPILIDKKIPLDLCMDCQCSVKKHIDDLRDGAN